LARPSWQLIVVTLLIVVPFVFIAWKLTSSDGAGGTGSGQLTFPIDGRKTAVIHIDSGADSIVVGTAELGERKSARPLPQIAMQEMLLAFRDVVQRAEMFAHHHVQRERLSVRVRMSDILATLERSSFVEFVNLFKPEEGRMGVTVTFVAILELVREGLIDIVQTEAYAPLHVRGAQGARGLRLAVDNDSILGDAVPEADVGVEREGAANESVLDESAPTAGPEPANPQTDGDQHE